MTYQKGNILFLILIAVALFAALSYAVTGSSRTSSNAISDDKAKIAASQIIQYATMIEQAISKMRLINGCTETQISFERPPFDGSDTKYNNISAPSDKSCHVYHSNGGGVPFAPPEAEWQDSILAANNDSSWTGLIGEYYFMGNMCLDYVGDGGTDCRIDGRDNSELLLVLQYVHENICAEINDIFFSDKRIFKSSGPTLHQASLGANNFKGAFGQVHSDPQLANPPSDRTRFCFEDIVPTNHPGDGFHYYHVLIAR